MNHLRESGQQSPAIRKGLTTALEVQERFIHPLQDGFRLLLSLSR